MVSEGVPTASVISIMIIADVDDIIIDFLFSKQLLQMVHQKKWNMEW